MVILPITRQSGRLLQRNLIYTAITRSKSKLIMLGEFAAFDYAIKNEGDKRQTYLVERFQEQSDLASSQPNQELKSKEQTSLFLIRQPLRTTLKNLPLNQQTLTPLRTLSQIMMILG